MTRRILLTLTTLLSALTLMAQARFTSNTALLQLGQIEWKHPASAQFVITNTGDKPLVLTDVQPDCACTVASWTENPIAPGARGEVNITFDAEALGHFQKSVAIYTNAEPHLVRLGFAGEVVTQITDYSRTHPYDFDGVRLSVDGIHFPDSKVGQHPVVLVDIANQTGEALEPVLMHLPAYVDAETKPAVLPKGGRGLITLTLDTERLDEIGLTQTSVYLSRFQGDRVSQENELELTAVIVPDFSGLTDEELAQAPRISLSSTTADFSPVDGKRTKRIDITVSNTGQTTLQIAKLQSGTTAVGVRLKKTILAPGETTRLRITPNKRLPEGRHATPRLLMITNDPTQPKVDISILGL